MISNIKLDHAIFCFNFLYFVYGNWRWAGCRAFGCARSATQSNQVKHDTSNDNHHHQGTTLLPTVGLVAPVVTAGSITVTEYVPVPYPINIILPRK